MPILVPPFPQETLGNWLKDNYALADPPSSDITWLQWWNNQSDIVIMTDEISSPIVAEDLDSLSESISSLIHVHIFVRDYNLHGQNPQTGVTLDNVDTSIEISLPTQLELVSTYIKDLIKDNPQGLKPLNIPSMEVEDDFEVPVADWDQEVYRWIIAVRLWYVEN